MGFPSQKDLLRTFKEQDRRGGENPGHNIIAAGGGKYGGKREERIQRSGQMT